MDLQEAPLLGPSIEDGCPRTDSMIALQIKISAQGTRDPHPLAFDASLLDDEASSIVTLSTVLAARITQHYQQASAMSLIGKILVCNPGPEHLSIWWKDNLHSSFASMVSLERGFFEVMFHQSARRLDALSPIHST
jgi:hypothetical protein